jgi:DNA primase
MSCGQSGSILDLLQKTDGVDFKGAVAIARAFTSEWNQNREKVEQTFKSLGQEEQKVRKTYSQEEYGRLENSLNNSTEARKYLGSRGISLETAQSLHLGYRQDVGRLAGEAAQDIAGGGWLVFPTTSEGKVTSLKYRSIARKAFCKQPGMATELFNRQTIDMMEPVFLVEGEFDAACLEQAGFKAVSLPNATYQCTPEDKDSLLSAEYVVLAGDNDDAGKKAMEKLWAEMRERTYLLQWPAGIKDANAFWDASGRDLSVFRTKIAALVQEAKSRPMAGIYSLQESLMNSTEENVKDDPNRFRFSLPSVDRMAIISPGSVIGLMATSTGQGKTTFVLQETLEAARRHGEVVLNYQAELTIEQVARIVTAHTLRKHRLELTKEDMKSAAHALGNTKYYIGRNATLTTIGPVLDLMEAAIRRLSPTVAVLDNIHYLVRNESDQVKAMENAMQRIKSLAVLYKLKFFVLGAPKKAESTSKGKQLHVTDARGSVTFGDDSDAVFTIHRDMLTNSEDKKNDYSPMCRLRLVKVRDKGPGDAEVELYFLGELATFSEVAGTNESGLFG